MFSAVPVVARASKRSSLLLKERGCSLELQRVSAFWNSEDKEEERVGQGYYEGSTSLYLGLFIVSIPNKRFQGTKAVGQKWEMETRTYSIVVSMRFLFKEKFESDVEAKASHSEDFAIALAFDLLIFIILNWSFKQDWVSLVHWNGCACTSSLSSFCPHIAPSERIGDDPGCHKTFLSIMN